MGKSRKIWAGDTFCTDVNRKAKYVKGKQKELPKEASERELSKVPRKLRDLSRSMADKDGHFLKPKRKRGDRESHEVQAASMKKKRAKKKEAGVEEEVRTLQAGEKYKFETTIREGESFRSYSRRIGREKRQVLVAQAQKMHKLSDKRKTFLDMRREKVKAKAAGKLAAVGKDDTSIDDDNLPEHLKNRKREFDKVEAVKFGEVAEAPPLIQHFPKRKEDKQQAGLSELAAFLQRKQAEAQDGDEEEEDSESSDAREERREEEEKRREKELLQARMHELMREKSLTAYANSKQKRKVEDLDRKKAEKNDRMASGNKRRKKKNRNNGSQQAESLWA